MSAREADAADAASLARAFDGVSLVAVAASVLEHAGTVARAALDAGADYFDLLLSGEEKFAALEALRPRLEAAGRCFITDGGIHPGLSAALIRALAPAFGRLERASVGGLLKVDWGAYDFQPSTIHEFASEFRDFRVEALRDGVVDQARVARRDALVRLRRAVGQRALHAHVHEGARAAAASSCRRCGTAASTSPGSTGSSTRRCCRSAWSVMKVSPDTLGKPYSRLLAWSLRRFSQPPYGTVFQAEAEGEDPAGAALSAGLRVTHPDGYWLTAAAAAACLLQWQDGSLREPGLHLQALAADPARLLRDLQRMGAGLEGRGVDVGELLRASPPAAAAQASAQA